MSKRILIVEDEGILRVGTTLQLISLGFEVVGYFQTGEEAIEQVTKLNPDLILMDIQLAGKINGIETVKEIQKKVDVPIVYLSAYSNHELIEEAETTNPFRYLIKPLDEMELKFTIETAIDSYKKNKEVEIKNEVLNNLNGLLYRFSMENREFTCMNGCFEAITGYTEDEIKSVAGHFLARIIMEEDHETVRNTLNNSLNLKKPYTVNYKIQNKNNKIRYIQEIGKPILGDNGEIKHIDGIIFDLNKDS